MPHLLAVDLGLKTGLAVYDDAGALVRYRSQNYGSFARLKRGAYGELSEIGELAAVVLEGDALLARAWTKVAERRGARTFVIQAHTWRRRLLLDREQRSGVDAKAAAGEVARRIIEASDAPRPTSLKHDAAEAILIGWWGCMEMGWTEQLPP